MAGSPCLAYVGKGGREDGTRFFCFVFLLCRREGGVARKSLTLLGERETGVGGGPPGEHDSTNCLQIVSQSISLPETKVFLLAKKD